MADPTDVYPESATHGGREAHGEGEAALRAALSANGETLAELVETTDDLEAALETAVVVAASADEADVESVTAAVANLVAAAEGLSTDGAARLATDVGEHGDDLSEALETVVRLRQTGRLDALAGLAEALSDDQLAELAGLLEADGDDALAALDAVLDLQRDGHLEDLLDLAETLSTLDVDEDTARGLNGVLAAVGEAQRESEPVGLVGFLRGLGGRDARAGLGFLLAVLRAQGRRLRGR
jgi:uncharacterized protein YjgD (DUF1641 family)